MLAPLDLGWDLPLYAQEWLEERFRLTLNLVREVAKKPKTSSVHDVRVACRRLREAISFFHGVTEVPPLPDVDRAARQMSRAVARLREIDVATKTLVKLGVGSDPEAKAAKKKLVGQLRQDRTTLARERHERIVSRAAKLETAITSHLPLRVRPRRLDNDPSRETQLKAFLESRVDGRRDEVERLFEAFGRKYRRLRGAAMGDDLHSIRVAIKQWRYSNEIVRAVAPRVLYRPIAIRLRRLQELGGKSQDFADLTKLIQKELARRKKPMRGDRAVLLAIQTEETNAALEFVAALRSLLPPSRLATTA